MAGLCGMVTTKPFEVLDRLQPRDQLLEILRQDMEGHEKPVTAGGLEERVHELRCAHMRHRMGENGVNRGLAGRIAHRLLDQAENLGSAMPGTLTWTAKMPPASGSAASAAASRPSRAEVMKSV